MPRAAIDIGSNSILLLVLGDDGGSRVDAARVVGLGRDLGARGFLRADRMDAALEVLAGFARQAAAHGVPPAAVRIAGTSALRRALNAPVFAERVLHETGLALRVVSGEEEARLSATGALSGLDLSEGPLVLGDPGGGSTEVIEILHGPGGGSAPDVRTVRSLEIGTIRITEACLAEDPLRPAAVAEARDLVAAAFARERFEPRPRTVVAVSGTATALAAAEAGQLAFDGASVHGAVLRLERLEAWIDRLRVTPRAERRALVPATPDYAETLLAGTLILERLLMATHRTQATVSARGLRYGLLLGDDTLEPPGEDLR
ncbi:MAG: hypothetical protein JXB39_04950 [Deltaproteobacteria bacterium]|nr:hypothetical protein [Deltaproteobacteria bacterium]